MALNWREYFNSKKYDPAKELATSAGIEYKEPTEGGYTGLDSWRNKFKYGLSKPSETTGFVEDEGIRQAQNDMLTEKEYLDNFTNQYVTTPLTQEEMAKRKAAAYNIGAIGALGNVASALSNLIFTGKGAVSQKIPDAPDVSKEVRKFEDDEQKKRNNAYALAKDRYAQARQRWLDLQNEQSRQQQLRIIEQRMKNYQQQGEYERWRALKAQHDALKAEIEAKNTQQKNDDAHELNQTRKEQARASAEASRASANASNARADDIRNNGSSSRREKPYDGMTEAELRIKASELGVPINTTDRATRKSVKRDPVDILKDVRKKQTGDQSRTKRRGSSGPSASKTNQSEQKTTEKKPPLG